MRASQIILPLACSVILAAAKVGAASAQWVGSQSSDWNDAANWEPNTIPNGPADIASFFYGVPNAVVTADTEVNQIILFSSDGLTIQTQSGSILTLSGAGISNNGPSPAYLNNGSQGDRELVKMIRFTNNATAGYGVIITNYGANDPTAESGPLAVEFHNNSNAGGSTIYTHGGHIQEATTEFYDSSSAANATFVNLRSEGEADGGSVRFHDSSTAANGTFENQGNTSDLTGHGFTLFDDTATAANAVIRNTGSSVNGYDREGGMCSFGGNSTAANAFIVNFGGSGAGAFTSIGVDSTAEAPRL